LVKAVLFDYGGTLVMPRRPWADTKPAAVRMAYHELRRLGLETDFLTFSGLAELTFRRYADLEREQNRDIPDLAKYLDIVSAIFPSAPEPWRRRAAARANDAFWSKASRNYYLRRNARSMLSTLKEMRVKMAVVSNHHDQKALRGHLVALGISRFFSPIIASAGVGMRKPDPRIFDRCLASMRLRPEYAVYVGNSLDHDIEGAERAGLRSILVLGSDPDRRAEVPSRSKPDFVIGDLEEVPRIVSRLH
jgi:HAD superfamily hydrolase (TIGR01549 family)